jgi:hypothetical protein
VWPVGPEPLQESDVVRLPQDRLHLELQALQSVLPLCRNEDRAATMLQILEYMIDSIAFQICSNDWLVTQQLYRTFLIVRDWFNEQKFWDLATLPFSGVTILIDNILHLKLILKMGNAEMLHMFSTYQMMSNV